MNNGPGAHATNQARASKTIRPLLAASQFLQWTSSVIVLGIVSYFINKFSVGEHLIYEEVIAALNVALYLPAMILPFMKWYKGYMLPVGFAMSYLWLTAFIFNAQDYSWHHNCAANSPAGVNKCGLKKTIEAFAFLTFFFTLTSIVLEYLLWDKQRFKGTTDYTVKRDPAGTAPLDAPVTTV